MNTGFNSINVPDSEATLERAANSYKDFPAIDCLQRYFLSNIIIRAFEDDVINGDYIKLWDDDNPNRFAFYSMNGYTMTSGDTIDLSITMDPLLTCGGVDNIDLLDGVVTRRTVHSEEMGLFNEYEEDPYLVPRRIVQRMVGEYFGPGDEVGKSELAKTSLIIKSCYDLSTHGEIQIKADTTALQVSETSLSGQWLGSPVLDEQTGESSVVMFNDYYDGRFHSDTDYNLKDGSIYTVLDNHGDGASDSRNQFMQNIKKLVGYGRTDIIQNAYLVPSIYAKTFITNKIVDVVRFVDPKYISSAAGEPSIKTKMLQTHVRDVYKDVYEPFNERALYGKHFAFTFIARGSGEKVTVNPEMIDDNNGSIYPKIYLTVDVRPTGGVTFYIGTKYKIEGIDKDTVKVTNTNLPSVELKSAPWPTMAITTLATQGVELNAKKFAENTWLSDLKTETEAWFSVNSPTQKSSISAIMPHAILESADRNNLLVNAITDTEKAEIFGSTGKSGLLNLASSAANGNEYSKMFLERNMDRTREKREFLQANMPQVQVLSSGSTDDVTIFGHSVVVYRSLISVDDLKRFDRILNQFGWKITEPIEKRFITGRVGVSTKPKVKYSYLEASGVSVKCDTVPKSVREDLANVLSGGLRIWHTDPKNVKYTDKNEL